MHSSDLDKRLESCVAVIGLAGRFPGAPGIRALWQNLRDGIESVTFFTDEELREAGVDPLLLAKPNYVKANAVLDGIEMFDAGFFGFTPREAEITDPQQRLFLEASWVALEDAGYDPSSYPGSIGVYAGVGNNTYLLNLYSNAEAVQAVGRFRTLHGNEKDFLAAWTAYKLNLRGPAITVQTACSTSLVAIHLACQALLNGECDMALAGGVSFSAHQKAGYLFQDGGIHSSDGHCRPFDARAAGTVGGNGLGIVVLRRLQDALEARDHIRAVVRGTAVNNDGSAKVGFTAPSVDGQAAVIAEALALAEVDPDTITYVETHGTATALGDPIEIAALKEAFQPHAGRRCGIGAVKSNFGHLDTASGVTGFIKTVLALEHGELPPTLHFESPNPNVAFEGSPFFVVDRLTDWPPDGIPRRAGVSSFGIGGTNAHAVLEEAPPALPVPPSPPWHLLALSARTPAGLETATSNLARFLEENPDADLTDIAYTLQVGRKAFQHRRIVVCRDSLDAARALADAGSPRWLTRAEEPRHRPVAFLFPGQGAQHPGMARGLYQSEPSFRSTMDRCCEALHDRIGLDLRDLLFAAQEDAEPRLRDTRLAQPALFIVEYALALLWMEWGIRPDALLGHSIGEYTAACLAGVLSLDDALSLVVERGRLMQDLPAGAMLAVALSEGELLPLLEEGLSLAAVNGPAACVVSGAEELVTALAARLEAIRIEHRRLHTSHAFHSCLMDPVLPRFAEALRGLSLAPPRIPIVSNLTGTWLTAEQATDPDYWLRHLRQTVRFSDGLAALAADRNRILLEVGPGDSLSRLARRQGGQLPAIPSLRHPQSEQEDLPILLQALGHLWAVGVPVDWHRLSQNQGRRRVPLPTYPFERQRYWVEPKKIGRVEPWRALEKRPDVEDWLYVPSWRQAPGPPARLSFTDTGGEAWLLFSEPQGPAAVVAVRLRQLGHEVIEVFPGEGFARLDEDRFTLAPRHSDHYTALFETLRGRGRLPRRIVHLWNLGADADSGLEQLAAAEARSFYSLLFLGQALPRTEESGVLRLDVVSSGLHRVLEEETVEPVKSLLLGPVRVLPRERKDVVCRSLDLVAAKAGTEKGLDQLVRELLESRTESVVALRGGRRWVPAFEPVRTDGSGLRVRESGTYLITGGLGGIGLTLAKELARRARVRLILVSRSGLPPREEWDGRLAAGDPAAEAIRAVRFLEEQSAEVVVAAQDVSDLAGMEGCLRSAEERLGPVTGVIHAAGVPGGGLLEIKTAAGTAAVLDPKVRGTLVLETLLRGRSLDFFVLCSSLAAVTGAVGQVDYCAANAFLDAFAQSRASDEAAPVLSVAWGAWQEVGMAVHTKISESPERRQWRLAQGLLPAEGVVALDSALIMGSPQVLVSPQDLEVLIELSEATDDLEQRLEKTAGEASAASHRRPDLAQEYVTPRDPLEREIAGIWQEVLGLDQVGVYDDFAELGGDSLMGIRVLSRLRDKLEVDVPLRILFENPTIRGLAAAVLELQLASHPSDEVQQLLTEVSALSQEELAELLAVEKGQQEGSL